MVKNSESHGSHSDGVNFNCLQFEQSICAKHFCPWKQGSTLLQSKLWHYPNEPGKRRFHMDVSAIIVWGSVFFFVLSSAAGAEGWVVCVFHPNVSVYELHPWKLWKEWVFCLYDFKRWWSLPPFSQMCPRPQESHSWVGWGAELALSILVALV